MYDYTERFTWVNGGACVSESTEVVDGEFVSDDEVVVDEIVELVIDDIVVTRDVESDQVWSTFFSCRNDSIVVVGSAKEVHSRIQKSYTYDEEKAINNAIESCKSTNKPHVVFYSWKCHFYAVAEISEKCSPGTYGLDPDTYFDDCVVTVLVCPS